MNDVLMNRIMEEVSKKLDAAKIMQTQAAQPASEYVSADEVVKEDCNLTEYRGSDRGQTIGMVIPNVDPELHAAMGIDPKYRSLGIISSRTGAGPQIWAADEAVKASNCEVLSIEMPRDTMGGCGHGCLIILGAEDVSDVKRAVDITLEFLKTTFGGVFANDIGYIELQYTARASYAINKAVGCPMGKAAGLIVGAPAGIGTVIIDAALKAATVDLVGIATPTNGTSYTNEFMAFITGDAGAVRQALHAAKEIGTKLVATLGGPVAPLECPYF